MGLFGIPIREERLKSNLMKKVRKLSAEKESKWVAIIEKYREMPATTCNYERQCNEVELLTYRYNMLISNLNEQLKSL